MATEPSGQPSPDDVAERFLARLRVFAARRLRSVTAAEDAAQETLRRVLEALRADRLETPEALPSFVFQVARNVCRLRMRSAARRDRAMDRLAAGAETTSGDDPLGELIGRERRAAVRQAVSRLSAGDRDLLKMLYHEGDDIAEVANRLGLQPGAVRVRKHRALRRLGDLLGEGGWGDPQ